MTDRDDNLKFAVGVVAVTGGIGSGKSSVCRWLRDKAGYAYTSADEQVALLLKKDAPGYQRLRTILTADYFLADGSLDKPALRSAIFRDVGLRSAVEDVLHPLVLEKIKDFAINPHRAESICLVEVPLLYEVGWQGYFTRVIVVYANNEICLARVQKRDNSSIADARVAINTQMPLKEKALMADYVVKNNGIWDDTVSYLDKLQKELDSLLPMS